jgi:hypothetical protein
MKRVFDFSLWNEDALRVHDVRANGGNEGGGIKHKWKDACAWLEE